MTTTRGREIGLAQLSALSVAPPQMVELAATHGYDFIGVRVRPVTAAETSFAIRPGSPMLDETVARMRDTGIMVKDIEFLLLDGSPQRDAWLQMCEAGKALGASSMTVAVGDTDRHRVIDTLGQMAQDARSYGITPALEPISYQAVNSIPDALDVSEATGVDILIDTLHVSRFGGTADELRQAAPLVPLVQICDATRQRPADREGLIEESRSTRLPAGEGGLNLSGIVDAVAEGRSAADPQAGALPVSVETPHDVFRAEMGDDAWVGYLISTTLSQLGEEL